MKKMVYTKKMMMKNKYKLEKSKDIPGWYVITDLEYLVVVKFEECKFNETQQVTLIRDQEYYINLGASTLARIMREIGDYLARYYGDISSSPVYGYKYTLDEKFCIYRRKYPKWTLVFDDQEVFNKKAIANSLRKAAEFLLKDNYNEQ